MRKIINKEIVRYVKEHKECEVVICDICGKVGYAVDTSEKPNDLSIEWPSSHHQILETNISIKDKWNYPDSGHGYATHYDICPDCLRKHILPIFEKLGVEPNNIDYNW